MNKQRGFLNKTLVAGIIFLFIIISFQSCIAIVHKEIMMEQHSESIGKPKWLANMQVEFRDGINNEKIIWKPRELMPAKDYYVNIDIKFRCLPNRKIVIDCYFDVRLSSVFDWITFFEYNDTFIIINGSNPPDISKDFINFIPPNHWKVDLIIQSKFIEYKFIDGEWIKVDQDIKDCWDWRTIHFINSRTSERKLTLLNTIQRFPLMERFLRTIKL